MTNRYKDTKFHIVSGTIAGVLAITPLTIMIKGLTLVRQIGFLGMIGAPVISLYFVISI